MRRPAGLGRDLGVRRVGRFGLWFIPTLTYIFLWVPIAVLVVYSFNNSEAVSVWRGFTLRWYQNLRLRFSSNQKYLP